MDHTPISRITKFTNWFIALALRVWPEATRSWGQAWAAELPDISSDPERLRWVFGGILLFLRAIGSCFLDWMKFPSGHSSSTSLSSLGDEGPRLLRVPRFVLLLLLCGSAAILLLPRGQQAISLLSSTGTVSARNREAVQIAAEAQKQQDARGFALAAFVTADPHRSIEWLNRAVHLDRSLSWTLSANLRFSDLPPEDAAAVADQTKQLIAFDPDNSFVQLLETDEYLAPLERQALDSGAFASEEKMAALLFENPSHVARMERAFLAPRYNNFSKSRTNLCRETWAANRKVSPTNLAYCLALAPLPQLGNVHYFVRFRIRQAEQLAALGQPESAASILREIVAFGNRMASGSDVSLEHVFGLGISHEAFVELHKVFLQTGRMGDAARVAKNLEPLEAELSQSRSGHGYVSSAGLPRFEANAAVVQGAALFVLVGLFLSFCGIALMEGRALVGSRRHFPFEPVLRLSAGYGPAVLLLSSMTLLIGFAPFARLLTEFQGANPTATSVETLLNGLLPFNSNLNFALHIFNPYYRWLACTVALSAIAVFLIARQFAQRLRIFKNLA